MSLFPIHIQLVKYPTREERSKSFIKYANLV